MLLFRGQSRSVYRGKFRLNGLSVTSSIENIEEFVRLNNNCNSLRRRALNERNVGMTKDQHLGFFEVSPMRVIP